MLVTSRARNADVGRGIDFAPGRRMTIDPEGMKAAPPGDEATTVPPPVYHERRHRSVGWQSRDVLRVTALVIAMYLVARLLWFANQLVLVTFLGVLFGLAVSAGVDRLQRFRIPRGAGAALIVITFFAVLTGIGIWLAPTLRKQGTELRRKLPQAVDRIDAWINRHQSGVIGLVLKPVPKPIEPTTGASTEAAARATGATSRTLPTPAPTRAESLSRAASNGASTGAVVGVSRASAAQRAGAAENGSQPGGAPSTTETLKERLSSQLGGLTKWFFPFLSSTIAAVAGLLLVIFLSIYTAIDPKLYHDGLMHLFPRKARPRAGEVLTATAVALRRWLITQLIAMLVIGTVTTIGLFVLGVQAAFALGVLAGLLEFIPTVGPTLSAVPAIAMGFLSSPEKALAVAVLYVGIQFLENHLLIPLLMKGGVDLPPALTILAQALMALVFGFLGLMVAVPMLAAVMVAVKMLYVEGVVGDEITVLGQDNDDADDG